MQVRVVTQSPQYSGLSATTMSAKDEQAGTDADARLRPPVVVITGASAGVGRAIADAFAARGWRVALIARGHERLVAAQAEIARQAAAALIFSVDVSDATALEQAAATIATTWGGIDIWINNAMATMFAPFEEMPAADFKRVVEVTFLGQVNGTRAALKHMRRRELGTIVQVNSALAVRSIPLQSAYCAAKAAVRGFSDALRSELLHEKSRIRVTDVYLPAVNTPQFDWARSLLPRRLRPVAPVFQPETIAAAIVSAALNAPRETWIGRPTAEAMLGNAAVPGWLDRWLARKAWSGQMTQEPAPHPRMGNLYEPVQADVAAHGRFDDGSRYHVHAYRPSRVRLGLLLAALSLGLLGLRAATAPGRRSGMRST